MTVAGSLEELMRTAAPYGIADVETHDTDLTDVFLGYYEAKGPCEYESQGPFL
jgi:ABC-2 type transport system ATP-binding protein